METQKKKIGGWLYFIALGVFLGPLINLNTILTYNIKMFYDGTFANLTSSTSAAYHSIYLPTLLFELLSTVIIFSTQIFQMYLFIKKDLRFPKVFSFFLIFSAFSALTLYVLINLYPNPDPEVIQSQLKAAMRSIVGALIWVPYMFKSQRVRETFGGGPITFTSFVRLHRWAWAPIGVLAILFVWGLGSTGENGKVTVKQPDPLTSEEIAKHALENLVVIEPLNKKGEIIGVGSGFFILPDLIVTNVHVVEEADSAYIRLPNSADRDSVAEVVSFDKGSDIALLKPKKLRSKSPLRLSNTANLSVGSKIYVAGNPEGLEGTFTDGLLSNKNRVDGLDILQISAPISKGSSGGPVLDSSGNVVGISTAYLKSGQNLNLAMPSVYITRLIMRTEAFYPLENNIELSKNGSIGKMFTEVCDYLVDVSLPDKYFKEIPERDMQSAEIQEACTQAIPSCRRAWYNKATGGVVFIGSQKLQPELISKLSKSQFEKEVFSLMSATKDGYRKTNPETKFKTSQKDINSNTVRYDMLATYKDNGEESMDSRSFYFVLPYCRLDVLFYSAGSAQEVDKVVFEVFNESFTKELPGMGAERALYKFGK